MLICKHALVSKMSYRFSKLRESDLTSLVYGNKVGDSIIKQLMNSASAKIW